MRTVKVAETMVAAMQLSENMLTAAGGNARKQTQQGGSKAFAAMFETEVNKLKGREIKK